jgi:hypothetical protein
LPVPAEAEGVLTSPRANLIMSARQAARAEADHAQGLGDPRAEAARSRGCLRKLASPVKKKPSTENGHLPVGRPRRLTARAFRARRRPLRAAPGTREPRQGRAALDQEGSARRRAGPSRSGHRAARALGDPADDRLGSFLEVSHGREPSPEQPSRRPHERGLWRWGSPAVSKNRQDATVLRSELGVSKRTRCGKRRMAVSLTEGARR